ncbi:hypothetical protein AA0115_g11568 [Alternaria tenuissima]|uniref:Uncharacterized protein n=1 Tax=Alternaria tenuissima TaxID=119927 RepID=A0AB37W247_9PLEO|nr:hypothetical protein AA0115_g11568 [Alternaria tenuissima]
MVGVFVEEVGDVNVYMMKDGPVVEAGLEADWEPQDGFPRG